MVRSRNPAFDQRSDPMDARQTAQAQDALQTQGTDALPLMSQIPRGREPDAQRRAGLVEDGAGRHRAPACARAAHLPSLAGTIGRLVNAAHRADEFLRPAQSLQIGSTRPLGAEPIQKFDPIARVVFTRWGCCDRLDIHPVFSA